MTAGRRIHRNVIGAVIVSTAAVLTGFGSTDRAPRSIAALGDSISAEAATTQPGEPNLANSWATGTNPKVRSIYLRLRQRNGARVRAFNGAEPGATMDELAYFAERIPKNVDLVTVEMGTNDACGDPPTSAADFRSQLAGGLRAIAARAPNARVVVVSIFDHLAVWDAVKMVTRARLYRSRCLSATTANGRRTLRKTIRVLNHELAVVCGRHPRCHYDGGAAYRIRWSRADVSSIDYFHPSIAGQRKIADAVWTSGAVTR